MKLKIIATALAFAVAAPALVTSADAQYRHGWRGHHDYADRGYHRNRGGWGPAIGFGLGAAAGAAAASGAYAHQNRNDAYCSQRFRSYDPASGTYMGYDGKRHPCP